MSNIFNDYLSNRVGEIDLKNLKTKPGPVVTISRSAGCSSQHLAHELAIKLNEMNNEQHWEVISKEILQESAQKLHLDPKKVKSISKAKEHNVFEDIIQAFLSSEYHMEKKVRNTIINVIHRFAVEGHKIILGRGGNIICSDIENALHIRIDAPLEWKINRVVNIKSMDKGDALHCIKKTEKKRKNFRKSIKGRKVESEDFDITLNQSKYSNEDIIEIIISTLKLKKIV